MLQKNPPSSLVSPPRWSWSKARSRWPDSLVLAGLAIATVGIGHGNTRVLAGGLSVTMAGGWVSLQRRQQMIVQEVETLKETISRSPQGNEAALATTLRRELSDLQNGLRKDFLEVQKQSGSFLENALTSRLSQLRDAIVPNESIVLERISDFGRSINAIANLTQESQGKISKIVNNLDEVQRKITQLEELKSIQERLHKDSVVQLINLCKDFHNLAGHQLQRDNPNFDETHVQNALEKLLRQQFPNADIRKEYVVPQPYSHGCRIDFLLVDLQCAIEVKRVRSDHTERRLIEELAIDFEVYRQARHPFETLICFIYDPTARLTNPQGLRDLEGDRGQFQVKVAISQPQQSA